MGEKIRTTLGAWMGVAVSKQLSGFAATEVVSFPPQSWEYKENTSEIIKIDYSQIISYDLNGEVCSRYGDDIWRLTYSLNPKQHKPLDFTKISDDNDRDLAKRLMFAAIHFSKGNGKTIKAPASIKSLYGLAILPMQQYSYKEGVSLSNFFEQKRIISNYLTSIVKLKKNRARENKALLAFLEKLPENISGMHYDYDTKHQDLLNKYIKEWEGGLNQSECIPPRILQNAQQMRWEHIDSVVEVLSKLEKLIHLLMSDPFNYDSFQGNSCSRAKKADYPIPKQFISMQSLIKKLKIEHFCNKYKIKGRESLKQYLSKLANTSRHLIYGYTGMRNDEGCLLEIGCYQRKGPSVYPIINGLEKKNGIPQSHPFVTIQEIEKVINVQTAITLAISKYSHLQERSLSLIFNPGWIIGGKAKYMEAISIYPENELPLDESRLILTDDEMKNTLKATEPNRDWDNDPDYQVGKVWKFKWHQYRRSIAVYALNSGLVSLTALGKQFRHFFEATTMHYGNGHFVAQPLAGTDSIYHVKHEMDNQREKYESLAMYRDMMFNLERPESGFAPDEHHDTDVTPEDQILDPITPDTIGKKLKQGQVAYTNTAIGSCKSIKPCDGHIMLFFAGCVDCEDAEVNDDKLIRTIESVTEFKQDLEIHMPGSVELRDIETDIAVLARLQQKRLGDRNE